jgi:hypothetical protein
VEERPAIGARPSPRELGYRPGKNVAIGLGAFPGAVALVDQPGPERTDVVRPERVVPVLEHGAEGVDDHLAVADFGQPPS